MLNSIWQFYGFDWLSLIFGLSATYLIGNHSRWGFVLGALAGATGIVANLLIGSLPFLVSSLLCSALYVRGYYKWRHASAPTGTVPTSTPSATP